MPTTSNPLTARPPPHDTNGGWHSLPGTRSIECTDCESLLDLPDGAELVWTENQTLQTKPLARHSVVRYSERVETGTGIPPTTPAGPNERDPHMNDTLNITVARQTATEIRTRHSATFANSDPVTTGNQLAFGSYTAAGRVLTTIETNPAALGDTITRIFDQALDAIADAYTLPVLTRSAVIGFHRGAINALEEIAYTARRATA